MSNPALLAHRRRQRSRGLKRLEIQVRASDAPLIRAVVAALADPALEAETRLILNARFATPPAGSLKTLLASAPLDGVVLERDRDFWPAGHPVTWLVDTNIISEIRRGPRCHPPVAKWWAAVAEEDLHLSVLTLGEIRKGIEALQPRDPTQAHHLATWLDTVRTAFGPRILAIDAQVAETWGSMSARRQAPVIDTLLAATALVHNLVLVTRNTADVAGSGARLLNPFEG